MPVLLFPPPRINAEVGDLILIIGEVRTGKTCTAHAIAKQVSDAHAARFVPVIVRDEYSLDLDVRLGHCVDMAEYVRDLTRGRIVVAVSEPEDELPKLAKMAAFIVSTVRGGSPIVVSNRKLN